MTAVSPIVLLLLAVAVIVGVLGALIAIGRLREREEPMIIAPGPSDADRTGEPPERGANRPFIRTTDEDLR